LEEELPVEGRHVRQGHRPEIAVQPAGAIGVIKAAGFLGPHAGQASDLLEIQVPAHPERIERLQRGAERQRGDAPRKDIVLHKPAAGSGRGPQRIAVVEVRLETLAKAMDAAVERLTATAVTQITAVPAPVEVK